MAINCEPKAAFFNADEHGKKLKDLLNQVHDVSSVKARVDKKKNFTIDFYNLLISKLKSGDTPFKMEYSPGSTKAYRDSFARSFIQLKEYISSLIVAMEYKGVNKTELIDLLNTRMQKDFGAGRLKISQDEQTDEFSIEIDGARETENPIQDTRLNDFIEDVYGNQFAAIRQLKNTFTREIFAYTLYNFDKGTLITSDLQLNKGIANYKNDLLKRITDFLQTIDPDTSYPSEMITNNGVHVGYYSVLTAMQNYLNDLADVEGFIYDEFSKKIFGKDSIALDAIHAYSMLKFFDSFVLDTMGKTIEITKDCFNVEVPVTVGKYRFSKDTGHHRKSWSDSDARTAAQNTSRFSKFVLQSIPLRTNGVDSGKNLNINLLQATMAKLFRNVSRLDISEDKQIKQLIELLESFHNQPRTKAFQIFDLIVSSRNVQSELSRLVRFTETDLGVIQSLHQYVFSFDSVNAFENYENQSHKSIRAIEFNALKTSSNLGKYSIVSDIVNVINDSMDASYFLSTYGYNGGLTTQVRDKGIWRRDTENFKDTITSNTAAYNQEQREDLMRGCQVTFNGLKSMNNTQHVEVVVPITLNGKNTDLHFNITATDELGILAQDIDTKYQPSDLDVNKLMPRILKLFGQDSPIDLFNAAHRKNLLSDSYINDDYDLMKGILRFIDDRLRTKFLSEDGLQKLAYFRKISLDQQQNKNEKWFEDLLIYSVKTQVVSDLYYNFRQAIDDPSKPRFKTWRDFLPYLREVYKGFANLSSNKYSTYFKINNGQYKLIPVPSSTTWVDHLIEGRRIFYGEDVASTSKNQSKNNDANYVTSFLGGQIFNVCYNAKQASDERDRQIAGEIRRIVTEVENSIQEDPTYIALKNNPKTQDKAEEYKQQIIQTRTNEIKIPRTTSSALFFTNHRKAIMQCVINSDIRNRNDTVKQIRDLKTSELFYNAIVHNFWNSYHTTGEYCIQPTTYSDKVKIIHYLINSQYKVNRKKLHDLSKNEVIELYRTTVGQASKLALDNLYYFYSKIFGEGLTLDQINNKLKTLTEEQLKELAFKNKLEAKLDFHYRIKEINGKKVLALNELIPYQAQYADARALKQKFVQEEINFINNLVSSGVFFYVDYHDTSLYDSSFKDIKTVSERLRRSSSPVANIIVQECNKNDGSDMNDVETYASKWIKNGKLILAYDQNGKAILSENVTGISEINPLLEKYFYLDTLLSNNLRLQLTGFETNHPDKSKSISMIEQIAKDTGFQNELLTSSNIERLQKAKIIWGHSALGKTTYDFANPDNIVEWDKEFNSIRNQNISKWLGDSSEQARRQFLAEFHNYLRNPNNPNEYNINRVPLYNSYIQLVQENWEKVKNKASKENKKVFASPPMLLEMFGDDFDLVLNIDKGTFLSRKPGELDWKNGIDKTLSNPELSKKVINVGDLYMADIMALNDGFDLYQLSRSSNNNVRALANKLITVVENFAQGTQLKRNVIIPATMHYVNNDILEGVSRKVKVAVINDIKGNVFNFSGISDKIDAMDGAAYVLSFQSILENKSLGSQEVGEDKKPIWGDYDNETGTATLLKFATFAINNERMRFAAKNTDSKTDYIDLYEIFKKMSNLQWSELQNGIPVSWKTSNPVRLSRRSRVAQRRQNVNIENETVDLTNDILEGRKLYYSKYDDNGNITYRQITKLGGNAENGYYTIEMQVDKGGYPVGGEEKVYHYFNENSEHYTLKEGEQKKNSSDHTINSLFELWLAMGGLDSKEENSDHILVDSEASNYAVVGFMNQVSSNIPKSNRFSLSRDSYDQPLKDMMIGYLANNSAVKNGAANRNLVQRWYDEKPLSYMTLNTDGLGIQMDADHDVEELATMTEFSQVIAALESGGDLHKFSKQVYNDLGKVALVASGIEIDTVTKYLAGEDSNYDEVKSQLYDIVTKTLINSLKSRDDSANLTDEIIRAIGKELNKNVDHIRDSIKVPYSDNNIYSQILPAIVSLINKKSIKRKYSGSGCVMVPGFDMMTYFKVNGNKVTYPDLVRNAIKYHRDNNIALPQGLSNRDFERSVVDKYLDDMQKLEKWEDSVSPFIPTDIVEAESSTGERYTFKLNSLGEYYSFKDLHIAQEILLKDPTLAKTGKDTKEAQLVNRVAKNLDLTYAQILSLKRYRHNIRKARNLAPVRITFERADGVGGLMNIFDLAPFRRAYEEKGSKPSKDAVQQAFKDLDNGYFYEASDIERKNKIYIKNLKNLPAEMIISNMYSKKFGISEKSIAQIREEGIEAFRMQYEPLEQSEHYDLAFTRASGENVYVSFKSPKSNRESNIYDPYKKSELLYEKNKYGSIDVWLTKDNRKQFKVGRYIIKEGYSHSNGKYYDNENKKVGRKKARNLKAEGSIVYEYLEFVSKYKVTEKMSFDSEEEFDYIQEFDKYYINPKNIKLSFGEGATAAAVNDFMTDILDGIYSSQQFIGVKFNPEFDKNTAVTLFQTVCNMKSLDSRFRKLVIKPIEEELRKQVSQVKDEDLISIEELMERCYNSYYDELAYARYSSWESSLYFTAARIPAQTLQSFMQMEAVAYSGNTENKVYVSHWQAWLQGSDYDIDKAYIMGQEFGDDGKLIKYSDLFDYSSLETLQASSWLPTPRKVRVLNNSMDTWEASKNKDTNDNTTNNRTQFKEDNILYSYDASGKKIYFTDEEVDNIISKSVNIDSQLEKLQRYKEDKNIPAKIKATAELIIDIYDKIDHNKLGNHVNITYSSQYKDIGEQFIRDIIRHERTNIPITLEESAYKNSISASIRNIVQDLKNMALAYSPITMEDLRDLADNSEKGALVANMSLMNPLTKFMMQVQNMVGKKVIGIAAVGEKVFFNLSYYYNEGVRSGDKKWIQNLQFSHTFDRIKGRYDYNRGKTSSLEKDTKCRVANTNFTGVEDIRERFLSTALKDEQLRKKYGITDEDIKSAEANNPTVKYQLYETELKQSTLEQSMELEREATDCPPVDLLISQILSAATDNAKELILKKINCDDNLAKFHLYLIMIGFDIKDVVSFMTSPAVNLISGLLETNMMDSYINNLKIDEAIDTAQGLIDASKFLFGSETIKDENNYVKTISRVEAAFNKLSKLNRLLLDRYKISHPNARKIPSLQILISEYIKARLDNFTVDGKPLGDFSEYFQSRSSKDYEIIKGVQRLSDYINKVTYDIGLTRAKYAERYIQQGDEFAMEKGIDDFNKDLEEFKKISKLADETTELGGVMLGMNQGLPSDKVALQEKLRKIGNIVTAREKEFGINRGSFVISIGEHNKDPEKAFEQRRKTIQSKFSAIREFNEFVNDSANLEDTQYYKALEQATAFDIVGNFDVEKWLYNVTLTEADKVADNFYGENINMDRVLEGKESISYREVVANYYNVIKGTWNIFDMMNRIPQYNAILDLLKVVYTIDKVISLKSRLVNDIYKEVYKKTNFINEDQNKAIIKYVNDLLITAFFRDSNLRFPVYQGMETLDSNYKSRYVQQDMTYVDLNNAPGRAAFKLAFEQAIAYIQKDGTYGDTKIEGYDKNAVIDDLQTNFDKYEVPRLALDVDMRRINVSPSTQKRFQEYLNGLASLKSSKKIGNLSLNDWLIAYNLFVNQNQYGSDRLTTIFKNSISGTGTLLEKYFKYIGKLDFEKTTQEVLDLLEYNIDDLLVRIAPIVHRSEVPKLSIPFIKTRNNRGELVVMQNRGKVGRYTEISLFPTEKLGDINSLGVSEEQKSNYSKYQMIPMKNQDFVVSLREGLMSGNVDTVLDTLITYSRQNLITIYKDC